MPTYKFTGTVEETFPFLPSYHPTRVLEPGEIVECYEPVEHPRLELIEKPKKAAPQSAAEPTDTKEEA